MEARKQSFDKKNRSVGKTSSLPNRQQPLIQEAQQFLKLRISRYLLNWQQIIASLIPTLQGAFLAAAAMFWAHLLMITWGMSLLSISALCCGLILAVSFSRPALQKIAPEIASIFLFVMTSTSFLWWESWDLLISGQLQSSGTGTLGLSIAAILNGILLGLLMISIRICSQSLFRFDQEKMTPVNREISATIFLGGALGLWVLTWSLNTVFPVYLTATASSGLLMLLCIASRNPLRKFFSRYLSLKNLSPISFHHETPETGKEPASSPIFLGLIACCAGWLTPAMYRVLCQLQPETTHLFYGTIAAVLLGLACSKKGNRKLNVLHLTAWLSLALLTFPLWMRAYLAISAIISTTLLAILLRQFGIIALFLPIGMLLGRILFTPVNWNTDGSMGNTDSSRKSSLIFRLGTLSCFLVGDAVSGMTMLQTGLPVVLISGLVALAGLSVFFEYFWATAAETVGANSLPDKTPNRDRFKLAGLTLCCLMSFGLLSVYQPSVATQALFSIHAFNAWRNGTSIHDLSGIDDGRLLAIQETPRGTLSLWKHQGEQIQLRRNGIPIGRISQKDDLVPQPTGELLSSALPLSIHPAPREILLLGIGSGLALQTTLEFPVMNVTCVESDSGILEQASSGELASTLEDSLNDDRLHIDVQSSALAIRRMTQQFDVIIDSPGHSAIYPNASGYDLSHYQRISKLLTEHGLYCQRFIYADYGPQVLANLSKTMRNAFGYVTAFDTAPGEMLFVAARQQEDVLSEGLITRISSPQVRRSLAKIGWDWSVAMNLGRFDIDQIDTLKDASPCSIWQGTGSFGLAVEMMRWGSKWTNVRLALANHSQRLLNHYQEEKEVEEIIRRLSDVTACQQVLKNHPDQFWVYRKTIQKRLVNKPRSVILPVKGEGLQRKMHPEDKRRVQYFEALGSINKKENFAPADLAEVEEFIAPFDPLISYFLHPELAKLYQRCDPVQPDTELKHLLHTIHFSGSQQRSVRSIHRALELLTAAESSIPAADRYDHINTLLEVLKLRWQVRKEQQGIAQSILLIDLNNSMAHSQTGLKKMQQLAKDTGVHQETVSIREQALERSLLRMLRSYRSEMLARNSHPKYPTPSAN